ncbi:TIGR03943 family putative permease subunit [Streptomyces pharetrae]|uniref:TIGR03943 family putative permease subunit n=1 Tax=Streptomyces pharetrae TaxID=291370 RepID=UPI00364964AB
MNRAAQAAVLFLLGVVVLHTGVGDVSLRYVKEGLRPLLLASGAVLVTAALATAWYERTPPRGPDPAPRGPAPAPRGPDPAPRGPAPAPREPDPAPRGPDPALHESHPAPRVAWLLLLPVLALVLVAPPALGSHSALRTGTALQRPPAFAPLPPGEPVRLNLSDYAARAVYDHGRSLDGRRVRVTGFVTLAPDGTPYLVRMTLNCCAADAQPVKIALTGRVPPVLEPDGWLDVTGTYTPRRTEDPVNGAPVPYLKVAHARPAPAPRDPYDATWNN